MRHPFLAVGCALVASVAAGCAREAATTPRTSASPEPPAPTAQPGATRLLRFTHHPADPREPDATVSLWFTANQQGELVAMRSSRVDTKTKRLLQETAFARGADMYTIIDHAGCKSDSDVEPPTAPTADGLITDSNGPLDAQRPAAEFNDGQVLLRIKQPTAEVSSRVVTVVEVATGATIATIDSVTLTEAAPETARPPLQPLRCTPSSPAP